MASSGKGIERVYTVEGMDCGSCATTLKTAMSGLPGVADVTVSAARERMTLSHDPGQTTTEVLEKTVRGLGFTPTLVAPAAGHHHGHSHDHGHDHHHHHDGACNHDAVPDVEAVLSDTSRQFRLTGMDCASCAATITSALGGLAGVSNPNVSVAREILTLDLDPDQTLPETVERTVKSLGFGIAPLTQDSPKAPAKPWWDTPKTRHLAVSVVLTALAFLGTAIAPGLEHILFTLVAAVALFPIAKRAFVAARLGAVFTIQMLMTVAAIGAVIIGEQMEALFVVLLFMVGEFLEGLAAEKARSGIKALGALMPRDAWLLENGQTRLVPADQLRVGQTVLVRPGDRMPADGDIQDGFASIDESPVTGESVPVSKGAGDPVFAGTVNHDAALQVQVTKAAEDNTIARIITMVEEAQDAKAPTERFIERFSKVYMPIIIAFAVAVAVLPPLAGFGDWYTWTYRALALLLIGCPCALVISVPAAIAASLSAGARHGILIKGGAAMEEIARATTVVFDKTGTLTEGTPRVTDVMPISRTEEGFLALAYGVEQGSSHPLAEAICKYAETRGIVPASVSDIRVVPGKGMEGNAHDASVFIGAPRFAADYARLPVQGIAKLESEGKTVAVMIHNDDVVGLIALRDEPRATTHEGLAALEDCGLTTVMMTGDNRRTAEAIGEDLGIEVEAEMLPEDKAARVRAREQSQTVMMVGDGVNDAPALAEASVGIAIGSGTDVAMEAADAALMRNDIADVARMTKLARGTMANIHQNVAIALGLKAVFLVTTVTGVSGLWMAVLADTGATVLVTLNAMRLLGYLGSAKGRKPDDDEPQAPAPLVGTTVPIRP